MISLFGLDFRWDQKLRPNRSTLVSAGVEFNQSAQLVIADVIGNSSPISPYFFVYLWNSEKVKWFSLIKTEISNCLTYLVHAKSIGELISFGFSDRSVWSLVSAKRSANRWVQTKNQLHFLAYLSSQSQFRTQRNAERNSNPESDWLVQVTELLTITTAKSFEF